MCLLMTSAGLAQNTPTRDVLGVHDLSSGISPMRGSNANACIYCHAPHNASAKIPLWNQTLSTKQYSLYPTATPDPGTPASVNEASQLCLSCHDGSVAVGQTLAIGTLKMTGTLTDKLGTALQGSHPFSFQPQIKDSATLVSTLVASHTTADAAVPLIKNNVECSTCHDVHNQFRDKRNPAFLVRDSSSSALCFACHTVTARTVDGLTNPLTTWPASIHAKSTNGVAVNAGLANYSNVSEFGCSNCHASHSALGAGLLRQNPNRPANVDDTSQACAICHDGSGTLTTPIQNVIGDFTATGQIAHPFADSNNQHAVNEPIVLDRNRHTTCADCHASHAAQPTTTFAGTSDLRPSQLAVGGVGADGSLKTTAAYQYENCLRCHGTSDKKQSLSTYGYMPARAQFSGDVLDVSLQFAHGATSMHPVMSDAKNLTRPSLLKYMWNIGFKVQGRAITSRILCTDCHNSDNNREFGGTGPNGVHGSKNDHILERQYVMSRVATGALPGTTIVTGLNPTPILDALPASPYALCAKCHDLNSVNSGQSWSQHKRHIQDGFSCSVCHSAHGVPAGTTGVNGGPALVSFDMNVVGPISATQPVTYGGQNSCTLMCHNHLHK